MPPLVPQKEQTLSSLVDSLESGRPGVTHPSIAVDSLKVITCWSAQFEAPQGRRSSRTAAQKFLPLLCAPSLTQDMNKFIFLILPRDAQGTECHSCDDFRGMSGSSIQPFCCSHLRSDRSDVLCSIQASFKFAVEGVQDANENFSEQWTLPTCLAPYFNNLAVSAQLSTSDVQMLQNQLMRQTESRRRSICSARFPIFW